MATEVTSQMGAPAPQNVHLPPVGAADSVASRREADRQPPAIEPTADRGTAEQLREAVVHLNRLPQVVNRDLMFVVDEESGSLVVKVVNSDTDEIIRQIPPDEALQRARFLEDVEGLIFRSKA